MATNHFLTATLRLVQKGRTLIQIRLSNNRGLVTTYNALGRAFPEYRHRSKVIKNHYRYYQLAKSIELDTDTKNLPEELSIRDSFKSLASAFNQHKDIYEGELNAKAKEETERALR